MYITKEEFDKAFNLYPYIVLMLDNRDRLLYKNYLASRILSIKLGTGFELYSDIDFTLEGETEGNICGERYKICLHSVENGKLIFASSSVYLNGDYDICDYYRELVKILQKGIDDSLDVDGVIRTKTHLRTVEKHTQQVKYFSRFAENFIKNQTFDKENQLCDVAYILYTLVDRLNWRGVLPNRKIECVCDSNVFSKLNVKIFILALLNMLKFYSVNSSSDIKISLKKSADDAVITFEFKEKSFFKDIYNKCYAFIFPELWIVRRACMATGAEFDMSAEEGIITLTCRIKTYSGKAEPLVLKASSSLGANEIEDAIESILLY